jgi:hypothetical protein
MAETDLDRRVLKLYTIYTLWNEKKTGKGWHRAGLKSEEVFNGDAA